MVIETLKCNCEHEGINLEYTYNLIQNGVKLECSGEEHEINAYGVEIESRVVDQGKLVKEFKEEIRCITPHKYKGSKLLHILEKNNVSPVHLLDIVEEIMDEYIKDFDEILNKDLALATI